LIEFSIEMAGYGDGPPVLRDVSGVVGDGEVVLVTGPSGSGKTTLLLSLLGIIPNLINGYVRGFSMVCGANALEPEGFTSIPRVAGAVLQDPDKQIVMPTPLDEVAFLLENLGYSEEEAVKRGLEVLERFGLRSKAHVHVELLSGGEKRRLTLALATAHNPPCLFLDEPSASIDPWGVREVVELVQEVREGGGSVMIVEHKPHYFLDHADSIMLISNNTLVLSKRAGELGESDLEELERAGVDARPPRLTSVRGVESGEVVLRARDLAVGYGERALVEVADFEVGRGEVVAVVGPNGSGKTTLLKTLLGALPPLSGEILIEGAPARYRRGRVYRGIFYVPQQPDYLFVESSLEREVWAVSRKTKLPAESLSSLIPWYSELKHLSPYSLSHGQRRWLAVAIAWAYRAKVILLDEPTAGLDYRLFVELKRLIEKLASSGCSFVIATHDPRVIGEVASRVYYINEGRLKEVGREHALKIMESAWRGVS